MTSLEIAGTTFYQVSRRNGEGYRQHPEWLEEAISCNKVATQGIGKYGRGEVIFFVYGKSNIEIAFEDDWLEYDIINDQIKVIKQEETE